MNRLRKILAFVLALILVISNLPADTAAAAVSDQTVNITQDQTQESVTPGEAQALNEQTGVITLAADDVRIHRSKAVNEPALEGAEYRLSITRSDLWYDYNTRKVIPSVYNLQELMTDRVGTSSDKGINRYPYVVVKVNVTEAGYYDLGLRINMNAATQVNSLAMVVDGIVYVLHPEKTDAKQTVTAENVYLTQGQHSILYTCVLPQNESEFSLNQARATFDNYYPWMNFWAFTFENKDGAANSLEILNAGSLTGTDVENIFRESLRIEAEDTKLVGWNLYNKAESNAAASADAVVSGVEYAQCQQTFADLTENGLDKAKTPYVQFEVEAPAAGIYYLTVGANVRTDTNNAQPVPFVAVIANDSAPVKAQLDGAWNSLSCATVAVQLKQGSNMIYCTSVTAEQYAEGTAWVDPDYFELQKGLSVARTSVSAADGDNAAYLYLNSYQDNGSNFGGAYYSDMRWDYPTFYEDMYGIYSDAKPDRAGYWPYIAFRVNAAAAGEYEISAKIETAAAQNVGMIVDGAVHILDVAANVAAKSVYLTAGEHIVIFTLPMPQDMSLISAQDNSKYPWVNYCSFAVAAGVSFMAKPTLAQIHNSMKGYSKMEAEDHYCASANGHYAADISKDYVRRYFSPYTATVKGAAGAVIDGTVTAEEQLVNTTQTYAQLQAGSLDKALTSYVQYTLIAEQAGTYVIRIGAYLEGSGTMPYGTVLVNGVAYKAQFAGNRNGYYTVNLPVALQKGENVVQLVGVTADQTDVDGWIGYDFVEVPQGVSSKLIAVTASSNNWDAYLYLNKYADCGNKFADPGSNTIYPDMKWDYPSLYEDMYGIYADSKPERAGYWPYIAFQVEAAQAGEYQISAKIGTAETAKTIGMIVDGNLYVVDVTTTSGLLTQTVYLTAGKHIIIFTSPIPQDMSLIEAKNDPMYPWMDFYAFELDDGLSFAQKPAAEAIKTSMQNASKMEAEDFSCASANGHYAADIYRSYTRRYFNPYIATIKGAAGATIDGAATDGEKLVNTTQTYAELEAGSLDPALTSYVQYTVVAPQAGTYMIRVGAYLEGSGTLPYGTVLVNGVAYKAHFGGNWNGYYAVNLPVALQQGENVIRLVGITADQTDVDGWIGYDFVTLPADVTAAGGRKVVSATDEDWADYLHLNSYTDSGNNFGGAYYPDYRYDYPSLYEKMLGIYSDTKPERAGYWPYIALRVTAQEAGFYPIQATVETAAAQTVGMIVDGATYAVDVVAGKVTESVYLTAGDHVIIFTLPMPRDMQIATKQDNALYPWLNYCTFKIGAGLQFGEKPAFEQIRDSMRNYSRVEAEDPICVTATGGYIAETAKTYTRRYGNYAVVVKGTAGAVGSADYVEYKIFAQEAGNYVIRVGAYLEGSGEMPYGTVLVNGVAYKAQFGGNRNGYDAVNLQVALQAGENTVQLFGVSPEQTATDGWIGYDFLDLPAGVTCGDGLEEVGAADEDWADYLYLNRYEDTGAGFGNAYYADMYYDYPSLYAPMLGIYSDAKADRADYWPYIAFTVHASKTGEYKIAAKVNTKNTAKTIGMIVDGGMYVVDVTTANGNLTESVYLTEGKHVIIVTTPMPRDMTGAPKQDNALYPYMDFASFRLSAGLSFGEKPTEADIRAAMTAYTRIEAEDIVYATYNANYGTDVVKKNGSRYNNGTTVVMGAKGAVADGVVSAEEGKSNTPQTPAQLVQGVDTTRTSYVEYSIHAEQAGTYVIRIGAYVEGSGTMPYGTILVNGTAYKAQFAGNWNGYDAVNLPVRLEKGDNTILCIGITADQTDCNAWIGYDYLDIPAGLTANGTGATLIHAGDETYVTFNKYQDNGDTLGGAKLDDLRWDRMSIDSLNYAYLNRMPYAAVRVTAQTSGKYRIYFTGQTNANASSKQIAVLVDGVTAHPMTLSEAKSCVTIYLSKGTHTLVFTTPMPADMKTASMTAKFDKQAYPWMDMGSFILDKGLAVQKAPSKSGIEKPFVTIEVEKYALPNLANVTATGVGSGVYLKAQTTAQILKDGIDPMVTPFVQYQIEATETGTYTLYVSLKSGMSANMTSKREKCSIVIENGDTRQVKTVYSNLDTQGVVRVIPVTLNLHKGVNIVRMTHFTGDTVKNKGYAWNDFDYIQLSPAAAKKLTFLATGVLEAEDGSYTSYQEQMNSSMSGEAYLGKGDYGYIDSNRVTFEALDIEDMGDLSRVTYLFEAEKAGTYTIAVKFGIGLINYKPEDFEKIGFAMIVNGKGKEKVELSLAGLTAQTTRLITVELLQGENEITFTASLADQMKGVSPKIESEYCLIWVDHDALLLSSGLSLGREAEKFGVEDSSVAHPQLELKGITQEPDHTEDPGDTTQPVTMPWIGIVAGIAAVIVLVILILILTKKKKQDKNS